MADTIKIPGMGPVQKKWVYVGGALVAGIVGYAYWSKSRAESSELTDYTEVTDPDAVVDGGVDEYVNPGGSSAPVNEDNLAAPTTNPEWSAAVLDKLTDGGYNGMKVSTALGKFFLRQTLTPNQGRIIQAGYAFFGPPPVGEYQIKVSKSEPDDDKPHTPKPGGPSVYLPGAKLKAPSGFKVRFPDQTSIAFDWNPVAGATGYRIFRTNVAQPVGSSEDTHGRAGGLKPSTRYTFTVRGVGSDGKFGPASLPVSAKTTKTVRVS